MNFMRERIPVSRAYLWASFAAVAYAGNRLAAALLDVVW